MPKVINVRVTTMDAELEFAIQSNTTGKQLFDQVVKTIGLREIWFFGLQYTDTKGLSTWLKLNKKVTSQDVKKESPMQFKFRAKFFPEDVEEELIQDVTLRLFFLQLKDDVCCDHIYCPPETIILLSGHSLQAKNGPPDEHCEELCKKERLPGRVSEQFSEKELLEREKMWWGKCSHESREDAMMEYLKIVQDLEMYGVNYFEIKNKRGTELLLGVDALGLNVYEKTDKLTPRIGFPWSEIRNISFNDKKFIIKPIDKKAPDFVFYAPRLRINKRVLALCMGNHELYMRRRKPDSIEVQQMKAQAKEEKLAREKERKQREITKAEVDRLKNSLAELEGKMLAAEETRKEQERKKREAEEKLQELSSRHETLQSQAREMEVLGEKFKGELEEMKQKASTSEAASEKLAQELEEKEKDYFKVMEEKAKAELEQIKALQMLEEQQEKSRQLEVSHQEEMKLLAASQEVVKESDDDATHEAEAELGEFHDISNDRSEEDRVTAAEKSEQLKKDMQSLKMDLENIKDNSKITENDKIHCDNLKAGRDKYKTLKQIRQGNTKQRVDEFEAM